ncbi:MAG: T9SS type A sorting domain-containing protein [Cytophagaceae bacterium]
MKKKILLSFFTVIFVRTLQAQPVQIHESETKIQNVQNLLNTHLYFTKGIELWESNGTASETRKIGDLDYPPVQIITTDKVYIITHTGSLFNLWAYDTHTSGTPELVLLKSFSQFHLDPQNEYKIHFTFFRDASFFIADDGSSGMEIWRTIGTPEGTVLLNDLNPGASGSNPLALIADHDNAMYFVALGKVYRSSGDGAPVVVQDFSTLNTSMKTYHALPFLSIVDNDLLMAAALFDTGTNEESITLWRRDDILETTSQYATIPGYTGVRNFKFNFISVYETASVHDALWITDGTSDGTKQLAASLGLDANIYQYQFVEPGKIAFTTYQQGGVSLWLSDGTPDGTFLFKTLNAYNANDRLIRSVGDKIFFADNGTFSGMSGNGIDDFELWQSDLTLSGTSMLKNITPADDSFFGSDNLTYFKDALVFTTGDGIATDQDTYILWRYNQPFLEPVITGSVSLNKKPVIFPNPCESYLLFENNNSNSIRISDIYGREVYSQSNLSQGLNNINIEDLSPGLYFISVDESGDIVKLRKQ